MAKPLLVEVAYKKIKYLILKDSSDYISENSLGELLNMSRTPIRAALQQLSHEGLITVVPNKGIFVNELTFKEACDLYDTRLSIEIYNLNQLTDIVSSKDISELEQIIIEQQKAVDDNKITQYISLDVQFHKRLLEIYHNEMFIQIFNNLSDRLYKSSKLTRKLSHVNKSIDGHRKIVRYLKEKEICLAVHEMEEHLGSWKTTFLNGGGHD